MGLIVRDEEHRVAAYAARGHPPHANEWHYYAIAFLPVVYALNRGKAGLFSIVLIGVAALCVILGVRQRIGDRRALKTRVEQREELDSGETRKLGTVMHSAEASGLKLHGLAARTRLDLIPWRDLQGLEQDGSVLIARFDRAPVSDDNEMNKDVRYSRRAYRAEFDSAQSAERFRQLALSRYMPPDSATSLTPSRTPA